MNPEGNIEPLFDIPVRTDVVDMAMGIKKDGGLEPQISNNREYLFGLGPRVDDSTFERLWTINKIAIGF
jgi:hypothetical protein